MTIRTAHGQMETVHVLYMAFFTVSDGFLVLMYV